VVGLDVRGGGEKELGLKNTLVSNMSLSKMILHYWHGLKNKYLRSVGKKERTMGERVTGKDRYTGPEHFVRCRKFLCSGLRKEIGRLDLYPPYIL
jgi:hypothetical protein